MIKEKDYEKMTEEQKNAHHIKVRKELIESGLLIPRKEIKESENHDKGLT